MDDNKVYRSFTDLEVWQAARKYKNAIYELVKLFPTNEKYRLEDQLIRASRSIGSNISEGMAGILIKINYIFAYRPEAHYLKR